MSEKSPKPDTAATHAGRMSREHYGAVNTPVYRASTILFPDFESLETGNAPYRYGRIATPSSRSLEEAITALEGGAHTVLCPSGVTAIALTILSVCRAGDHLLMVDSCYGPTRTFCDKTLARYGVETTYYDPLIGAGIEALFRSNTRAVFCESPGSLTFEMQDVPAIAAVAHARGLSVLMDNTWATPLLFAPLAHGVDLAIVSATKYVGGHADAMMGYVCANDSHADRIRETHYELGLCSGADDCFLVLRGLRTLPVRLVRHQETALRLAHWLDNRPEVERVLYPALENDPGHLLWKRDFKGASGLFGVLLKPVARRQLGAFLDGLRLFKMGYSWGGYESLVVTAHFKRTALPFRGAGPLIRFHAGLEDAEDLLADLEQGLGHLAVVS